MLALTRNSDFLGIVGCRTKTSIQGQVVCIGDVVKISKGDNHNESEGVVGIFEDKISVMGFARTPLSQLPVKEITLSHTELSEGDEVSFGIRVKAFSE